MRSLLDSLISLNFIIYIMKVLLGVLLSTKYTYVSIRVTYSLVVYYLINTIGRERLSQILKSNLIRQNALKNITLVINHSSARSKGKTKITLTELHTVLVLVLVL